MVPLVLTHSQIVFSPPPLGPCWDIRQVEGLSFRQLVADEALLEQFESVLRGSRPLFWGGAARAGGRLLFKSRLVPLAFGWFPERRVPGKNGEGTPRPGGEYLTTSSFINLSFLMGCPTGFVDPSSTPVFCAQLGELWGILTFGGGVD